MADYPGLTIWTDAYLADCAGRLTAEEHGVYLLMMQLAWREPDARLPERSELITWVKQVCKGMHGHTARALVNRLLDRFWQVDEDGKFYQKRLEKELIRARNVSQTKSKASLKGWQKRRESLENKDIENPYVDARARDSTSTSTSRPDSKDNTPLSISLPTGSESEAAPDGAPTPNGSGTKRAVSNLKTRRAKTSTRKTVLPDDFLPDIETTNYCLVEQCDGNRPKFKRLLRQFTEHAKSNGVRKADWQAACRLYIAGAIERQQDKADQNSKFAATRARMAAEEKGKGRL